QNEYDDFTDFSWSADSRWLAYANYADNLFHIVKLWSAETGQVTAVTTDRFDSYAPAFSPDGKWLYFLSDRNLKPVVSSPWGSNQHDPILDKTNKIYQLALKPVLRSPFQPKDELQPKEDKDKEKPKKEEKPETKPGNGGGDAGKKDEGKKDDAKKDEPKKDD